MKIDKPRKGKIKRTSLGEKKELANGRSRPEKVRPWR
jgi:hypothetical protein